MVDQDLSGESLKVVRYRIIFTKRDYEATLKEEEDIVTYSTNEESYGGLKVAQFLDEVRLGEIPRPQIWQELNYPSATAPLTGWKIPTEDLRYIRFIYEVVRHVEMEDRDYDKGQLRVLDDIRDKL